MRLWHEELIPRLPRQQLLGQHRECCALRGLGWNKKHATVDYVFQYSPYKLYQYHLKVLDEMKKRGYNNDPLWENPMYRGKACPPYEEDVFKKENESRPIYPEHHAAYMEECIDNLSAKGIHL
ncbi:TIGR02328 family protein [Oceanobacillus saliphilus]|uniref:TIGR02328 family protein n=1 Tax=Oceanobacillus saliphilus TaxID=2925834 RepID=UPI00201E5B25|nr:TIGR02328 family protein [Oceanobacillus saliphilus]